MGPVWCGGLSQTLACPMNPLVVEGRGTEEVKTNDVTGRVVVGEVGFHH